MEQPDAMLAAVGARVRSLREQRGYSRRELSDRSGLSERFLAQLELGRGNISLRRFAEVAMALATTPSSLLADAEAQVPASRPVALLGVRGAGKSTVGARVAARCAVPFVEIDHRIEAAAGLSLAEIFELHGEGYYRRLEREALDQLFAEGQALVLAAGGSIVTDEANYALLRERAVTVWLRARPEDHWNRVIQQGDARPMAKNPHAFAGLRALLTEREPLYARAHHVIDTAGRSVEEVTGLAIDAAAGHLADSP